MREIQLYIKDKRVDLFDDETIEVKSSIQDARDIGKVFTDYSKTFSVPASSTNNQIFKHFYNFSIDDGFDGRVRHSSQIHINHLPFKRGRVFLNGVVMKNKKPSAYRITFFGNTVSLKDKFGDLKLSSLDLSDFDFDFSHTDIYNTFTSVGKTVDGDTSAMIFPLITPKKRLFYDDDLDNTNSQNYDGNLYRPASITSLTDRQKQQYFKRGLTEADLKPAIKVYHIIKAIEQKFDLVFIPDDTSGTEDFLSIHNEAMANLYMWISNTAGNITDKEDEGNYFYSGIPRSFTSHSSNNHNFSWFSESNGNFQVSSGFTELIAADSMEFNVKIRPADGYGTVKYRVKFVNVQNGQFQTIEGSGDTNGEVTIASGLSTGQTFRIEFSSKAPMEDTEIIFEARKTFQLAWLFGDEVESYTTLDSGTGFDTNTNRITIKDEMPDMKIIDFMKGLFQMFNLTAYVIDDETDDEYDTDANGDPNVVKVLTLDDYYADAVNNQSGGTLDITDYIDTKAHTVDTSLPFSEIEFAYEENTTVIKENHTRTFGEVFGDSTLSISQVYPDTDYFFGEKYKIKPPFTILKYERIEGTDIQWGYAAGGDFQVEEGDFSDLDDILAPKGNYTAENIKPLLFYGVRETSHDGFNFSDSAGTQSNYVSTGYYRPSNTNETVTKNVNDVYDTPPDFALTFDAEIDEFLLHDFGRFSNSLFNKFYKNYITSVFDKNKRMFKFTAYMPPSFLIHYRLNDQLKIQDTLYRINSITTNLTSGKTTLELINLNSEEVL
jgi:hypothetical protein